MSGSISELEALSRLIKYKIIRNSWYSGTPHLGSCLSCTDILVWIYWDLLKVNHLDPKDQTRDRFLLSKGHAAPALFQVLAKKGFFSEKDLEHYGKDGSIFGEHPPTPEHLPGVEAATGSLGHGLSIGLGIALSAKLLKMGYQVFVVVGDGECNEGAVWEAAMMAASNQVENLTVVVDYNKWQATGRSNEVFQLASLREKWASFGWLTSEVDGNCIGDLKKAWSEIDSEQKPKVLIANTIKGAGIPFMEDDNNWHYRIPTYDEVLSCADILSITKEEIAITEIMRQGRK